MRAVLIAAAAVLAIHTLSAQSLDPAFQEARAARAAAIAAGDDVGLRRYTTDDFVYVGAEGQLLTRAERETANQGNSTRPPRPRLTEVRVRDYGDTIITSGRGALNVRGGVQPIRVTQVWVKQNGEWKVAHAQNTVIAGKE